MFNKELKKEIARQKEIIDLLSDKIKKIQKDIYPYKYKPFSLLSESHIDEDQTPNERIRGIEKHLGLEWKEESTKPAGYVEKSINTCGVTISNALGCLNNGFVQNSELQPTYQVLNNRHYMDVTKQVLESGLDFEDWLAQSGYNTGRIVNK